MSKPILFIGNGINRLENGDASWEDVLTELAGAPLTEHEEKVRKLKPFTLWFEELLSKTSTKLSKKKVCESLQKSIKPNRFHEKLMNLAIDDVLTTNYDYALEQATTHKYIPDKRPQENYYSLFRRNVVASKKVWHIHGEVGTAKTIMLGHGQYSGYVAKVCNYLARGVPTKAKRRDEVPYVSKFSPHFKGKKASLYEESWVDKFLSNDVHVLGFGFDYTENELWHLLTVKRILSRKRKPVGKTIFHWCSNKLMNEHDEARHSLLRSLNVEIQVHKADSYEESYDLCIGQLEEMIA